MRRSDVGEPSRRQQIGAGPGRQADLRFVRRIALAMLVQQPVFLRLILGIRDDAVIPLPLEFEQLLTRRRWLGLHAVRSVI
jgi:hypothetical protein